MRHKAVAAVAIVLLFLAVSLYAQEKTYVGADKCKLCHKIEYTSWAATKHAKAFDSLKPEDRAKKECVECHVTGGKAEMPGVQCEACHGPGSQYKTISIMKDKQKAIAAGLVIPTEKNCVQCHNKKSPTFKGFNFAEMAPKVHDKKKA
jgi:DnaJ-class molecular chaperone